MIFNYSNQLLSSCQIPGNILHPLKILSIVRNNNSLTEFLLFLFICLGLLFGESDCQNSNPVSAV